MVFDISSIKFDEPLMYSPSVTKEGHWTFRDEATCIIQTQNVGTILWTINPDFETDFRSGPNFLNPLIPKKSPDKFGICWAIHDAAYSGFLSRKSADWLLHDMLLFFDLGKVKSAMVYMAVDLFGNSYYKENGQKDDKISMTCIDIDVNALSIKTLSNKDAINQLNNIDKIVNLDLDNKLDLPDKKSFIFSPEEKSELEKILQENKNIPGIKEIQTNLSDYIK